ncbi:hypothetical protein GGI20_006187, partial [Coemansia sp. BCRC 34301]
LAAARTRVACDPSNASVDGLGTLYIDEQRLVFFSSEAASGFAIDYPTIVIHAVSRSTDTDSVGSHLYCQLDGPFPGCTVLDDDDDDQFVELKFFPESEQLLDDMFKAMSDCAALNPDDGDESCSDIDDMCVGDYQDGAASKDDEENVDGDDSAVQTIDDFASSEFITTADDLDRLTPQGKATLAHLESVIVESTDHGHDANIVGRFDDAD